MSRLASSDWAKDRKPRFYNYKSIPNRYKPIMKPILTILTGLHLIFPKFETKGRFLNKLTSDTCNIHTNDTYVTLAYSLEAINYKLLPNRLKLIGLLSRATC